MFRRGTNHTGDSLENIFWFMQDCADLVICEGHDFAGIDQFSGTVVPYDKAIAPEFSGADREEFPLSIYGRTFQIVFLAPECLF